MKRRTLTPTLFIEMNHSLLYIKQEAVDKTSLNFEILFLSVERMLCLVSNLYKRKRYPDECVHSSCRGKPDFNFWQRNKQLYKAVKNHSKSF